MNTNVRGTGRSLVWLGPTLFMFAAALAAAGCGERAAPEPAVETVPATTQVPSEPGRVASDFDPALEIDLERMTRSASGLYIQDVQEGSGETAEPNQTVVVHYTGWLPDGQQFDSSRDRGDPFVFTLGVGQVIRGWDEGVEGMRVGGRRKLVIPSDLAYGERGAGSAIPPNATLVFDVELLEIR